MNRKVVMLIEHIGDRYKATFPDYASMENVYANDASTLLRAGEVALSEEIERRRARGLGIRPPQTLTAHVFNNLDLVGKMLTVIEVEFPG